MSILDPIKNVLAELLNSLYLLTKALGFPSYGLAIIVFTTIVKLAFYPLNHKQMKAMKVMQELQPKIKEIQQREKDPQKANQKIMELYREYKVNPAMGCLPLLLQLPILWALFSTLRDFKFVDVAHAKFLWIGKVAPLKIPLLYNMLGKYKDLPAAAFSLSTPDPIYLLPLLAGLSSYLSSKLSTPQGEAANNPMTSSMMIFMPVFIAYIALSMPSGLVLYWVVFNLLTGLQQFIINRQFQREAEGKEVWQDEPAGDRKKRKDR